jgi:uracil-xanthine permease
MSMFRWELVHSGKTPPPGEAVGPMQRMNWWRTLGAGAQHTVAMFGGAFLLPLLMGLDPNLALIFSGVSTIAFLLVTKNRVPSFLGTSASFVAGVAAIRAQGGRSTDVTGAILVAGLVLAAVGVAVHYAGPGLLKRILPPAVTGAVVMLIGFNLAPVVAHVFWPQDPWVGLCTALFVVFATFFLPGFWARTAILLGLIFGVAISWIFDVVFGPIQLTTPAGQIAEHYRLDLSRVGFAPWFGIPHGSLADGVPVVHGPSFSLSFILLVLPSVIALVAENTGHVRAIGKMTGDDLDPYVGRALFADGATTAVASLFGGCPTTTYADNMGVMAATRIFSSAAYYVAALVAIALGCCPKVGAFVYAVPGGVLGGVSIILYGMVGLIGAKI